MGRRCFFVHTLIFLISLAGCHQQLPEEITLAYNDLPKKVDFNFHIRPILSDRCYACHGPDQNQRKAGLRFDVEKVAKGELEENPGRYAIVPGKTGKSQLVRRIVSKDPDYQMPPPESNLSLSAKEKALIIKWIEQGAEWKEHWAFILPQKPEIPQVEGKIINPIDNFILQKLNENRLGPSPEADKERLIRRVTVDLTGLPPTLQEIDDFLVWDDPQAYAKLVDRLLATDAHAERMTLEWLDVARYADSQGMHIDMERYSWPWRDWVIGAFKKTARSTSSRPRS